MHPETTPELAIRAAARWPRRTAVIFHGRRITYRELLERVDSMRAALSAAGVGPGDRVAVHMENRVEYLAAYYAAPGLRAVVVPLNTFLAPAEIARLLTDSGAAVLVTSGASLERIAPALEGRSGLRCVLVCPDVSAGARLPALRGTHVAHLADAAAGALRSAGYAEASPEDPAVLVYTSGTTGEPRGVVLSHRNLLSNAAACIGAAGISRRDRVLLCLPMFHSFTQTVCMVAPVMAGMSIVLCAGVDRAELRRAVARHRPSILPGVPPLFAAMARVKVGRIARRLNPVRLYISGGAPLSLDTLQSFERTWRRPLCEGYGLSEASPVVSLNPPRGPRKPGSVGPPLPGLQVRVVGPDGSDLPSGTVGELVIRGPSVMKGYHDRPLESARALLDGWLRTGDLARLDEEGYIFLAGRSKEMLICRGMNVYPREIEAALEGHPAVREAAVVGVPDARRGEVPLAFVVTHPGEAVTGAELRRACAASLARYKVPRDIRLVESLPRNPAGKVLKQVLRETALSLPGRATPVARRDRAQRPGT